MSILITLVKGQFYVCKDLFTTESFIRQIELGEETLFGTCFLVCVCSCVCMCICVTLLCSYIIPISFCSHHLPCLPFAGILSTQSPYSTLLHSIMPSTNRDILTSSFPGYGCPTPDTFSVFLISILFAYHSMPCKLLCDRASYL